MIPPIDEMLRLYKKGLSCSQIADKLHATTPSIYWHLKNNIKIRDNGEQLSLNKLELSKWFNEGEGWEPKQSSELFYVLAVLMGDGYISIYTRKKSTEYRIGLGVTDREFIEEFIHSLRKIGISHSGYIFEEEKIQENWKNIYKMVARSRIFVEWCTSIDLNWIRCKAVKPEYKLSFIKGIYESEGHLSKRQHIEIVNTNKDLMDMVNSFLKELSYHSKVKGRKIRPTEKTVYRIRMCRRAEVKNLLEKINPCIERKRWSSIFPKPTHQHWIPDEDYILKNNYNNKHIMELMRLLPNRTKNAINKRARRLEL